MESFETAAVRSNICISKVASFTSEATSLVNTILSLILSNDDRPNVIVVFANSSQAKDILQFASDTQFNPRAGQTQLILGQHAMSDTTFLDELPISASRGVLGIIPNDIVKVPEHNFLDFFKTRTPSTVQESENPWFKEYWQKTYECNLDGGTKYPVACSTAHETMHMNTATLHPYTDLIQSAINNFLTGLNTAQQMKCGSGTPGLCQAFKSMTSMELLGYVKGAGYKPNGDPTLAKFAVQNYKMPGQGQPYEMKTVSTSCLTSDVN